MLFFKLFCFSSYLILFVRGGAFATCPIYETDLFGSKYLVINHGRMFFSQTIACIIIILLNYLISYESHILYFYFKIYILILIDK